VASVSTYRQLETTVLLLLFGTNLAFLGAVWRKLHARHASEESPE